MGKKIILNKLAPINLGTWKAESLTSYITRLAYSHSISTYKLISNIISQHSPSGHQPNPSNSNSINGIAKHTEIFSESLETLTNNSNIKCMTLSAINDGKSFSATGITRNKRAWCQKCFAEQRAQYGYVYEPLLWAIQTANFCPDHHEYLTDTCPHCNKKQPYIIGHPQLEYCIHCKNLLFTNQDNPKTYSQGCPTDIDEWSTFSTADLIEHCSSTPYKIIDLRILEMISRYKDTMFDGNSYRMSQLLNSGSTCISMWEGKITKPTLKSSITISYYLNKPFIDLIQDIGPLTFPRSSRTKLFRHIEDRDESRTRTIEQNVAAEKYLKLLISKPPNPFPSLPLICQTLGCTPGYINYRFPELRKDLRDLYIDSVKLRKADNISKRKLQIKKEMTKLYNNAVYPSYNALSESIPRGWFKNIELAQYRRNLIKKLYSSDPYSEDFYKKK